MPDRKITNHTVLIGLNLDPDNDPIEVVDVNDTTDAPTGTNKKIVPKELLSRAWAFFRNVANTFDSIFTNVNTAARTYTFQDRDGEIADTWNGLTKGNGRGHAGLELVGTTVNAAVTNNVMKATPFRVWQTISIDSLKIEVTTGTTGNLKLLIYADTGAGVVGSLIYDSGSIVITAPGVYSTPTGLNITLKPGLYYLVYWTDTSNTVKCVPASSVYNSFGYSYAGTIGSGFFGWQKSLAFGATPNPFNSVATSAVNHPLILFTML